MTEADAIALVRDAVEASDATWADLGAGAGTFTRALATLLGATGTVYAIDRNGAALHDLERAVRRGDSAHSARVLTQVGDFTTPLSLPPLDGVVIANALHYVAYDRQASTLADIASLVRPGGRVVVVEYEQRGANRWVPFPISQDRLASAAAGAGLLAPEVIATRPSRFGGGIYSAVVRRPADVAAAPSPMPDFTTGPS